MSSGNAWSFIIGSVMVCELKRGSLEENIELAAE